MEKRLFTVALNREIASGVFRLELESEDPAFLVRGEEWLYRAAKPCNRIALGVARSLLDEEALVGKSALPYEGGEARHHLSPCREIYSVVLVFAAHRRARMDAVLFESDERKSACHVSIKNGGNFPALGWTFTPAHGAVPPFRERRTVYQIPERGARGRARKSFCGKVFGK